jgi:hypothetical protein
MFTPRGARGSRRTAQAPQVAAASVFEQLKCIAALHEQSGEPTDDPRRPLRTEHQTVFEHWLSLKLAAKIADLEACAANEGVSALEIVRHWIQPRCHCGLIPDVALPPQRELFELEFEILLPIVAANSDLAA